MATNRWYTNDTNTIVDFTVADAADVENKCDDIADAFDLVEAEVDALSADNDDNEARSLRHATDDLDPITSTAANRAGKVVGFDGTGGTELKTPATLQSPFDNLTIITTTASVAVAGAYYIDPSAEFTITLPASPDTGDTIWFSSSSEVEDYNVTIDGDAETIDGDETLIVDVNHAGFSLVYDGSEWRLG